MNLIKLHNVARTVLGCPGRMIFGSKSAFRKYYPAEVVVFNANVCVEDGKIWYGDINFTTDIKQLQQLADSLNQKIYVVEEHLGRFHNELKPVIEKAVFVFHPYAIELSGPGYWLTDRVMICKRGKHKGNLVYKPEYR